LTTQQTLSRNGVDLHVVTQGNPAHPAIVFLHGYPDCHQTFNRQFEQLKDRYHLITFDMRGVGQSTASVERKAYRVEELMRDVNAVVEACVGMHKRVHMVGHDWGSVIGWSFVSDPRYQTRVASWTSLSGPHLGILKAWSRGKLRSPTPRNLKQVLSQLLHSWYTLLFQIPKLPELFIRRRALEIWQRTLTNSGVEPSDEYLNMTPHAVRGVMLNPLGLYRDNLFDPSTTPEKNSITVPTQLIVLEQDNFIRPAIYDNLQDFVVNLTTRSLAANHWAHRSHAQQISDWIDEFVQQINTHTHTQT